jgi:serine/threonine-protein kinase HipA
MRKATVFIHGQEAGFLLEKEPGEKYVFEYLDSYTGPPISMTMPIAKAPLEFNKFPPFFDGLLPEGLQLEGLLKVGKIDRFDYFSQLTAVGGDLVGAVTVEEAADE